MTYSIFNGEEYYILSDYRALKLKITFKKDSIPSLKKLFICFYKKANNETLYDNYINQLISNIPIYIFQNNNYQTKTNIQYKMVQLGPDYIAIKMTFGVLKVYYLISSIQKLYKQLKEL